MLGCRKQIITASIVALVAVLALPSALAREPEERITESATRPFAIGESIRMDVELGPIRVVDLQVQRDERRLLDSVLPPRGGQSRFSWLEYTFYAENPSDNSWTVDAEVLLYDKNGAIIDEFDLDARVWRKRRDRVGTDFDIRRLAMNYVLPLIDRIEVRFTATR